jgi:CRP-like cAMP-binding protein
VAKRVPTRVPEENRLLAALPKKEYDRLLPHLEDVSFTPKEVVYRAHGPIDYVCFPTDGVFSMIVIMEDGSSLEVATVGNEGMLGISAFLGGDRSHAQVVCQIPGRSLRMRLGPFQEEVQRCGPLHARVQQYAQVLLTQLGQSTACSHLHSVEKRMCRWLLMTHDRVRADELPLTQEFLAEMLGVRRATVTEVAGALQRGGLIRYQRGRVTILDRRGLEAASCECYRVVRGELNRLLG